MNLRKLRGRMAEEGITIRKLSLKTGISYSKMYRVANGKGNLCLCDAEAICEALNITDPEEKVSIFLTDCPNNGARV